jgi:hypothetical protein
VLEFGIGSYIFRDAAQDVILLSSNNFINVCYGDIWCNRIKVKINDHTNRYKLDFTRKEFKLFNNPFKCISTDIPGNPIKRILSLRRHDDNYWIQSE